MGYECPLLELPAARVLLELRVPVILVSQFGTVLAGPLLMAAETVCAVSSGGGRQTAHCGHTAVGVAGSNAAVAVHRAHSANVRCLAHTGRLPRLSYHSRHPKVVGLPITDQPPNLGVPGVQPGAHALL